MFFAYLMLWGGLLLMTQSFADEPSIELHRTRYSGVDAGLTFTEVEHPQEDWQPCAPTAAEQAAGFIPFTRPETYDIRPWSRPRETERVGELTCALAKGETTAIWFAIYALEPLQRVRVEVVRSQDGISVSPSYVHFWAQRYDWQSGRYYIIPELLLQMDGGRAQFPVAGGTLEWRDLNVPQAETCLFWLRVSASQDVPDGQFTVDVIIRSDQRQPLRLPLRITVYPFRLQKPPDKRWLMYSDSYLLGQMSDEKLLTVLKQMKEYGIDGLTELPIGEIDISSLAQGIVRYNPEPLLRWHRLLQQAGMPGPHTIGTFIEEQVVAQLGIQTDLNREWPQPLREAIQLIARTVVKTLEPHGIDWLFYAWDEPTADNVRAIEQYRNWREGGARTYVTVARDAYLAAAPWLTHPCFATDVINLPHGAAWARSQCRRRQQQFYWYGSGCYLFQEGRMLPNRYLAGWLLWKTKADGQVSWTFVRPHQDPFNDFDGSKVNSVEPKDQCTVYPLFTRPNDRASIEGIIPTIQWEALREGVHDYCYLYTLRNTVAYARRVARGKRSAWAQRVRQAAAEGEQTLIRVEQTIPWPHEPRGLGLGKVNCTNADLQKARLELGESIARLVQALEGVR
jgi:hypothetical protein